MIKKLKLIPVLILILILHLSLNVCAQAEAQRKVTEGKAAYYLVSDREPIFQLSNPPLPGSDADRMDIQVLREWQMKRTPDECARAQSEAYGSFENFFGKISPFLRPVPAEVSAVFDRIQSDLNHSIRAAKQKYRRPRPFQRELELEPCLGMVRGFSYPSGHAAYSRLFALILSELQPERKSEFMARADQAALNRVIGGVHYPTDIEAGKKLAEDIFADLRKNPDFRRDLEILKQYIAH